MILGNTHTNCSHFIILFFNLDFRNPNNFKTDLLIISFDKNAYFKLQSQTFYIFFKPIVNYRFQLFSNTTIELLEQVTFKLN